jgi:hypothetical protein
MVSLLSVSILFRKKAENAARFYKAHGIIVLHPVKMSRQLPQI